MVGLLAKVGAGLVLGGAKGYGEGLVAQGKAKRERMLMELGFDFKREMQANQQEFQAGESDKSRTFQAEQSEAQRGFQAGESEKQRGFTASESEKNRKSRAGLLGNTERFVDEAGNMWLRHADGTLEAVNDPSTGKQLKGVPKGTKTSDDKGMAAKRALDTAVKLNTETDENGISHTNWDGVAQYLRSKGFAQEADMAIKRAEQHDPAVWKDAMDRATQEAEDKAGWLTSDTADFGGSREEWITKRAQEIYNEMKGGKKTETAASPKADTNPSPGTAAKTSSASPTSRGTGEHGNPPADYPDAQWSDKADGWVVQRKGKWYKVTE